MNPAESKLHQLLIKLTKDFINKEFFEYRKERNWMIYDNSSQIERLMITIREVKEYKNGYFDDEIHDNENENNDNYD